MASQTAYAGTVISYPSTISGLLTGGTAWTTAADAEGSGTSPYAVASDIPNDTNSNPLLFYNFGFSLPAGATINGIQAVVKDFASGESGKNFIIDGDIYLCYGEALVGSNKASASGWPTSTQTVTYGSSSDLWGGTWTATQINNSTETGFAFVMVVTEGGSDGSFEDTATVLSCQITITYTPAPAGSLPLVYNGRPIIANGLPIVVA